MSLGDFLGNTVEITVIDFLTENVGFDYSVNQLKNFLKMNAFDIENVLVKLIYNGLVVENDGRFQIANNKILKGLRYAIFANSFHISEKDENISEDEELGAIREKVFG